MVNKLLQLELNDKLIGDYTTDENGEAQLSIDTTGVFDPEFRLKVSHQRDAVPQRVQMLGMLNIRNVFQDNLY